MILDKTVFKSKRKRMKSVRIHEKVGLKTIDVLTANDLTKHVITVQAMDEAKILCLSQISTLSSHSSALLFTKPF